MSDVVIRSIRFFLVDDLFLALSCSNVGIKNCCNGFPLRVTETWEVKGVSVSSTIL